MRKLFAIILFFGFSLSLAAQDIDQIEVADSSTIAPATIIKPVKKLSTGFDIGMGYMFSSAGFNGPEFYLAPHLAYPVNNRLWLNAGIMMGVGNYMFPSYSGENTGFKMLPMTRAFLYASGNYKVNERLVVSSTVYKQVIKPFGGNNQLSNYSYNGMSVGFDYKIGRNITVGAQIHFNSNNMNSPYGYNNGFGNMYNPYYW